jgi:tight adherence protein C
MPILVAAGIFATISGMLISLYYVLSYESPITQRLRLLTPETATTKRQRQKPQGTILRRAIGAIGQFGVGRADGRLDQLLASAGMRSPDSVAMFLGMRTLVSFGPALLILVPRISAGLPVGSALWMSVVAWCFGFMAANLWLRRRSRKRIQTLTEALPDSLDLMVVCLESGLGLNATISRVGEERSVMDDPLGEEFGLVAFEIRSGRTREEALRALGDRNGVDDLKGLTGLIIQSDKLGASMAKTLRAHADLLRVRRRQRAEEAARKLPIKVLFPLATLLLPPLFVMIVGPAFLAFGQLVKTLVER